MPTLRELQKRLESAETIKQLSGAMRTAGTAKYTKLCAALDAYSPYAAALRGILPGRRETAGDAADEKTLCLLISGNRGLCGGYHQELFAHYTDFAGKTGVRTVTCGKKALEFCRQKKIEVEQSFEIADIPRFADAKEISSTLFDLYSSGEVTKVCVVSQHFINMLKIFPETDFILRGRSDDEGQDDGTIFIPDRRSVVEALDPVILASVVYEKLLSAAAGAQAATVVAMRSAFENATNSISSLEIRINRMRQAAVTASVLETAIDIKE